MRLLSFVFVLTALSAMHASAQVDKYSINLMWINKSYSPEQRYVRPAKDENELIQKLILPVCKWAKTNPEADVVLWYHGDLVSTEAVERTKRVLDAQLTLWGNAKAQLKDLREIPIVAANPVAFSDRTPVYLRVDLLKFIVVLDSIERNKMDAAIFADLEIGDLRKDGLRMGKDELFNAKVMNDLNEMGLVIGNGVENQFVQVLNNERIAEAVKHVIINVNLARIEAALNFAGPSKSWVMQDLWKGAFHSTREDIWRYIHSKNVGRVRVCPGLMPCKGSERVDYDPRVHGHSQWGLYFYHPECDGVGTIVEGECYSPSQMVWTAFSPKSEIRFRSDLDVRGGNTHSGHDAKENEVPDSEVRVVYWN